MTIDLQGTVLEAEAVNELITREGDPPAPGNGNVASSEWMECVISDRMFRGAGDARKLGPIIEQFRAWVVRRSS